MQTANQRLVLAWFEEVWNKDRRQAIAEMLAPDFVMHDGETNVPGVAGFEAYFDQIRSTFSNMRLKVEELVGEGDTICARWSVDAEHTGSGMGVDPTGKTAHTTGLSLVRVANGKFVEAWQNWDQLHVMMEIGAVAPAGQARSVSS
jgi:predicted ester cyclase